LDIERKLNAVRREASSDAPGGPERFRRTGLAETEPMAQDAAIFGAALVRAAIGEVDLVVWRADSRRRPMNATGAAS
jgi:hypothetical protein